jgi:hypothetical protein
MRSASGFLIYFKRRASVRVQGPRAAEEKAPAGIFFITDSWPGPKS